MQTDKVKILIIDESKERIDEIKSFLPEYFEIKANSFGVGIKEVIKTFQPHLIIMFADDRRGQGLYLFSWIKSDDNYGEIPVLLLSENTMSERILQFLEVGDAQIYYPTQGQGRLFLLITEMLQEVEESYYDKLIEEDIKKAEGKLSVGEQEKRPMTREELEALARQPAWHAESMEMLRAILDARKRLESNPAIWALDKACAFSTINHTVHVNGKPTKSMTLDNAYRRQQLRKSLARGEKHMMYIQNALFQMLQNKIQQNKLQQNKLQIEREQTKQQDVWIQAEHRRTEEQRQAVIKESARIPQPTLTTTMPISAQPTPTVAMPMFTRPVLNETPRPAMPQPVITPKPSSVPLMQQEGKKKILVVDDDIATLKTIKTFLQEFYDVVLVNSGAQAIDYIVRYKADLLIIDYRMPMLDGATTLKSIRYQPNGMNTPAFFLTALADQETIDKCLRAGATGVITKPISQKKILTVVASYFQK